MSAQSVDISRRRFADEENMVVATRKAGERTNVTIQALRRNVSALIGSMIPYAE